jgi:hypothetical protein
MGVSCDFIVYRVAGEALRVNIVGVYIGIGLVMFKPKVVGVALLACD